MKKQIAIITASFLIMGSLAGSAQADNARRHTMEGFLMGAGFTLLGTAIAHNMRLPEPYYGRHGGRCGREGRRGGHWEIRKIWVDPVYKIRWNPGHYNRHGRWVRKRKQRFQVARGYWQKKRVWVRHRPGY